jgi:hypothetical protein
VPTLPVPEDVRVAPLAATTLAPTLPVEQDVRVEADEPGVPTLPARLPTMTTAPIPEDVRVPTRAPTALATVPIPEDQRVLATPTPSVFATALSCDSTCHSIPLHIIR